MAQRNGTTGTQNPGGNEGGEDDTPAGGLSADHKKEVEEMVAGAVNGAVTSHLTRFKKQFTEEMAKTFGEQLGPIAAQLKDFSMKREEETATAGKKPGALPDEVQAQLHRYEAQIKELLQANSQEKAAREQEKATRLRDEERSQLVAALTARGFAPAQARAAVALLHTEDKKVSRAEDGRIVFKATKGTGPNQYVDEMDLEKGVEEWLKSDEGKAFAPARDAGGSGNRAAKTGNAKPGSADAKAQAGAALAQLLGGGGTLPLG